MGRADWTQHGLTPDALPAYPSSFWFEYGDQNTEVDDQWVSEFPDSTGAYYNSGLSFYVEGTPQEIYVEFYAMLPTANPRGANKFFKIFGANTGIGYANSTYQLSTNGEFAGILFGDGTTDGNDNAQVLYYNGSNPTFIGRNFGVATVSLPAAASFVFPENDNQLHRFRIKHRFNSGTTAETEINDGEYYVEVDGVVYCHATGIFNRHYTNALHMEQIGFMGVTQDDDPLKVVWDTIQISTGGFMDGFIPGGGSDSDQETKSLIARSIPIRSISAN